MHARTRSSNNDWKISLANVRVSFISMCVCVSVSLSSDCMHWFLLFLFVHFGVVIIIATSTSDSVYIYYSRTISFAKEHEGMWAKDRSERERERVQSICPAGAIASQANIIHKKILIAEHVTHAINITYSMGTIKQRGE